MLFTAYELPFTVHYPAATFFSRGEDVRISLRLRDGATAEIRQAITRAFSLFQALANCGGLCGKAIDPVASGIAAVNSLGSSADRALYELRLCRIDDRSLVTLVDLLLHRDIGPFVAAVNVDGLPPANKLSTDFKQLFTVHPERYSPLPFTVRDEQPETGAIVVELTLRRALEPVGRDALQAAFDAWHAFVVSGGFSLAPLRPDETYVEPDGPLVDFDHTVEWTLFKFSAHPAALDSLINIVARFQIRQEVIELAFT